jgi:hypothetical protein
MRQLAGVIAVASALFFPWPLDAQQAASGVFHRGIAAKAVTPNSTFTVTFPVTPVGSTSVQDCYYNCFLTGGGNCNYSGTIALVKPVAAPFRVINLRKAAVGDCGGTPASLPITLQAGEWLLQDFVFSPTAAGSFQDTYTYNVTPTGSPTDTTIWVLAGSTPAATARIVSFGAVPPTIRPGQAATLSWTTAGATSVVIDNGVGAQPASGSVTVTPSTTTTYTLTAMSGASSTTAQVTVIVLTAPSLVISAVPQPILQLQNTGGGTTTYTVANNGGTPSTVTVFQSGNFFSQSPTQFTLTPGASQIVTVTANALMNGVFDGAALLNATGVPFQLQVPLKVFSAAPPAGTVTARPSANRVDLSGQVGASPTGSVSFTNSGNATLTGFLKADVPWLIPQSGLLTIPAGSTTTFTFTVDRTKRTDDFGSAAGSLSLVFLSGSSSKNALDATPPPSVSTVAVVDTVPPTVTNAPPPPLAAGEIALFIPGAGHVTGSVGTFISDVSVLNPPGNAQINDIRFYYSAIGGAAGSQKSTSLPTVGNTSVAFADVVKNVFGNDGQVGSLQVRSASADKLQISTNIFNVSNPAGTYGTAIPTFRSDRAVAPGDRLVLTGIRQDAGAHTNFFIQETAGASVTVQTEFFSSAGATLGMRSDTVGPFGLSQINNAAPSGAVAAILTNANSSTGRFLAYATPVDNLSGDNWSIVDWSRQYGYAGSDAMIIPVAGVLQGANNTFFRTDVAITNTSASQGSGTLRFVSRAGTISDRQITLGARQTSVISDVIGTFFAAASGSVGYLMFTPATGTFAITSRTYTTVAGQTATFGTGVPTLAAASALQAGALRPIGPLDDSTAATVGAATPATFRTNFGLLETTGNAVHVRATLRFNYPVGQKLQASGAASKDYFLTPNQYIQLNGIASEILGASRNTLGDLHGLELDIQVLDGSGAIWLFTSSTDNGTGDSILRTE